MDFPSINQLIAHYNIFLLSGPVALAIGFYFAYTYVRFLRGDLSEEDMNRMFQKDLNDREGKPPKPAMKGKHAVILFAVITFVIGSAHFIGIYASVRNAFEFRAVKPEQVKALAVKPLKFKGVKSAEWKTIEDPEVIREGLAHLKASANYTRNHESYYNGYLVRFVGPRSSGGKGFYVSFYKKSTRIGDASILVPHVGMSESGTINNAGEYQCPSFGKWVEKHVDPLFPAVVEKGDGKQLKEDSTP